MSYRRIKFMDEKQQENMAPQEERRKFLKLMLGGGLVALAAAVVYPVLSYLKPPKIKEVQVSSVKVGKIDEFSNDSGTIFKFGNKPGILLRTASGEFRAFEAVCTHLDCTVQFKKDMGVIWCACHNGKYDLNGRNISGPPPRPLNPYKVIVQGEEVFVSKIS
jgi:cytochrome b6-f complex iron-sulfur subunit